MENVTEKAITALRDFVAKYPNQNVSAAARDLGLKNMTLKNWIEGNRTPSLDALQPVFDALGWQLFFPGEDLAEYELIPKTSARAGAGSSHLTDDKTEGLYAFRKKFLSLMKISKNSVLIDVMDDSMEPTLRNGDTILIDRSDTRVTHGNIYLVSFQDQLLIKRLFKGVGGIILKSDNAAHGETLVPPEYMDDFIVWGRMRWMARTF